jgi:hypothetical protein
VRDIDNPIFTDLGREIAGLIEDLFPGTPDRSKNLVSDSHDSTLSSGRKNGLSASLL